MDSGRFMQIGIYPNDIEKSKSLLRKIKPVSVIIMGNEFSNLEELKLLIKTINDLYTKEFKIKEPLLAVDQEGGNVARLREINYSPGNYLLGKFDNPKFTYYAGMATGYELKKLGFHWNLAPVLDVMNNSDNYIVMERSFGDNPAKVALHGYNFIQGLQKYGVSATSKHFPGHGSVMEDSHVTLPVDKRSWDSILNTMYPFIKSIEAGVKSIMMTHIVFRSFDTDYPVSLSKKWHTFLREDLNFKGVIISDSMDMKAIRNNYNPEEIAKLSSAAGADVIECVDPDLALDIYESLKKDSSDNSSRLRRIENLYIENASKIRPPPEVMEWISSRAPTWFKELKLDPNSIIQIFNLSPSKYMIPILERIANDLKSIGVNVILSQEEQTPSQIIFVGKNLHINGNYKKINELCKGKKCVYLSTSVPVDTGLLNEEIGYINSGGDKYENIKASIYSIIDFY